MRTLAKILFVLPMFLGVQASARADEPKDAARDKVVYQQRTRYEFDDDVVEGTFMRPDDVMVGGSRHARHPSLLKMREDFLAEMYKSVE